MPTDGKYGFSVLVGGRELPEYEHPEDERRILVESVLWSPVTYWLDVREYCSFSQEIEHQKWPVTPYEIKVYAEPHCVQSWYDVFVDGVEVSSMVLNRGESKVVKGFREGDGAHSEFLFSLPRFAESERDRVKAEREDRVGKIEVVRKEASFSHREPTRANDESKECKFKQANKKDVKNITKMNYTMTTTKRGRYLRDGKPYDRPRHSEGGSSRSSASPPKITMTKVWDVGRTLGSLCVEYHMTQTLLDWNVPIRRVGWPGRDLGTIVLDD